MECPHCIFTIIVTGNGYLPYNYVKCGHLHKLRNWVDYGTSHNGERWRHYFSIQTSFIRLSVILPFNKSRSRLF